MLNKVCFAKQYSHYINANVEQTKYTFILFFISTHLLSFSNKVYTDFIFKQFFNKINCIPWHYIMCAVDSHDKVFTVSPSHFAFQNCCCNNLFYLLWSILTMTRKVCVCVNEKVVGSILFEHCAPLKFCLYAQPTSLEFNFLLALNIELHYCIHDAILLLCAYVKLIVLALRREIWMHQVGQRYFHTIFLPEETLQMEWVIDHTCAWPLIFSRQGSHFICNS